jgi:predicted lysophospholipase L1 biosynthesis ABC-type transport system permease subunit
VSSIGTAQNLPLRGGGYNMPLIVAGRPDIKGMTSEYRMVSPGYLETMGFVLRQGRTLSRADRHGTEPVVVINETLARTCFGGSDPIGKMIGDGEESWRVVGVVADAVERGLTEAPVPVRYVAAVQKQWIDAAQSLVIRAAPGVDPTTLLEPARRTIARIAPGVAVQQTTTMDRVRDTAVGPARQVVQLLSTLTALALILGAVGIYGVIAHFATRRRRDWAIRVALGLPNGRVVAHVIGHGATLVTVGIAVGAAGAVGLTRWLSALLYGVSAIDPIAFAAAAAALFSVGLLAAGPPAWRAGMTDPVKALREP